MDQILHELVAIANARHENSYIFGGFNTQEAPYNLITDPATGELIQVADLSTGMDGQITHTVEEGVRIPINIRGSEVFQTGDPGDPGDLFQVLIDLRDGLRDNDPDAIQSTIDQLDEGYELVNEAVTRIGGYVRRLQDTEIKLQDHNVDAGEHLSKAQDADLAEWISRFQLQQVALETAMQLGGRLLPRSLVDFI